MNELKDKVCLVISCRGHYLLTFDASFSFALSY